MKKLYFILLLAFFLRVVWLDRHPSGFDMDEVQVGYNAFSILKTLRDENGNLLPLHTSFFNEARPMLSMYLAVPWIALFGLNVFAVRFAVALLGVFAVYLTYVLVKKLDGSGGLALLSSALLAISPWHISLSRSTADGALGFVSLLASSVILISWIKSNNWFLLVATYFSWMVTFFSYIGARPFVYIHVLFWIIFLWQKHRKTQAAVLTMLLLLFTLIPVGVTLRTGEGLARYRQIGNITPEAAAVRLQVPFLEDSSTRQPLVVTRVFHNKLENSAREFFAQYFQYTNLNFLFAAGGYPNRYRIPEQPLQYWFELPFFLFGIFAMAKRLSFLGAYPLFWFFAGAIPAALTTEDAPNLQRAVFMLSGFQIVTGSGMLSIYKTLKEERQRWLRVGTAILLFGAVWEGGRFVHQYVVHQPTHQPWHRNVQFEQITAYVADVEESYDKILVSKSGTEPYLYFLFFTQTDPQIAQALIKGKRNVEGDWDLGEKVRFIKNPCPLNEQTEIQDRWLYGNVGECGEVPHAKTVNIIRRPDNTVAMRFLIKE